MVRASDSAQQRKKRKHSRIGGCAKGERCERVCSPSEAADHMSRIAFDCGERGIQHFTTERVVNDVEALARSAILYIGFNRLFSVDTNRANLLDECPYVRRDRCI